MNHSAFSTKKRGNPEMSGALPDTLGKTFRSPRRRVSPKTCLLIIGVIAALFVSSCGADKQTGFQGLLTDANGVPITGSKNITFTFFGSISNCASGTDPVFTETHNAVPVTNGLLNVQIGSNSTAGTGIAGIDPSVFAQPLYLGIEIDGEKLLPCQKLMGAPYAMSLVGGAVVGSLHEGNGAGGSDTTDVNYGSLTVVAGSTGTALAIGSNGGDLIRACSGVAASRACGDLEFRVQANGNVTADGTFTGGGADFAELVSAAPGEDSLEPGDVLAISPDVDRAVVLAAEPNSTALMGVYSTKPGFVGSRLEMENAGKAKNDVPVAIVGIVPVKVSAENGAIKRGDLLTTSATPGHAMKATSFQAGTLLGKAMGELESGTGVIEVLLMLR